MTDEVTPPARRRLEITVVIVTLVGGEALERCRAAILSMGHTVLVAHRDGRIGELDEPIAEPDVPSRRRAAALASGTEIVAFLEDTVVPLPGWSQHIRRHLADGSGVAGVGGPVTINSGLNARTAALATNEFGGFQPVVWTGGTKSWRKTRKLPGANFAYRREQLLSATEASKRVVDSEAIGALRKAGWKFLAEPSMAVEYVFNYNEGARLRTRYAHGKLYAARFYASVGLWKRFVAIIRSPALPILLSWRSVRLMPRDLRAPIRTRIWIVLQQTAWSLGEFAGALRVRSASDFSGWN